MKRLHHRMQPPIQPSPIRAVAPAPPESRWIAALRRVIDVAPLLAVLSLMVVTIAVFSYLRLNEQLSEQQAVQRYVEHSQEYISTRLTTLQHQLAALGDDVAPGPAFDTTLFDRRANAMLTQHPELRSLRLVDAAGGVVATQSSAEETAAIGAAEPSDAAAARSGNVGRLLPSQRKPLYTLRIRPGESRPTLYLHVPLAQDAGAAGQIMAEIAPESLLDMVASSEILTQFAVALVTADGHITAGQRQHVPATWLERLGWPADQPVTAAISPTGELLQLRAQAWHAAQSEAGQMVSWLMLGLSIITAGMLITNHVLVRRRLKVQRALEAETSFRRAMENSMVIGLRALDLDGRIIYVNSAFCRMTGWRCRELIGQSAPFSYWPAEDHAAWSERLAQELAGTATSRSSQVRIRRRDGSTFEAQLDVSPLMDAHGKQTGWMAAMANVTEPNRVKRQLAAAQERFKTVLDALDASVSVAPIGSTELLFANKRYREWFGSTTEGHLGLIVQSGSPQPRDADEGDAVDPFAGFPLGSLAETRDVRATEIDCKPLAKWLETSSRYLTWVDGRLVQMVIAIDVTARHAAEERAARQAEHTQAVSRLITMGEMASSVAHELNQPLTAISNYCAGLISRSANNQLTDEQLSEVLKKINRQAERASQVVQHIRDFVKRSEPRRQHAEIATIVDQVAELAEMDLQRRQILFSVRMDRNLPPLHADPILIEQVLINLIKNGADSIEAAQRPPGQRRVALQVQARGVAPEAAVEFAVTDTGAGFSASAAPRLFEVFFSTKGDGMGMGLNLCRSIVEAHQGRIEAANLYNEGEVVGCRFTFWIPVSARSEPHPGSQAGRETQIIA